MVASSSIKPLEKSPLLLNSIGQVFLAPVRCNRLYMLAVDVQNDYVILSGAQRTANELQIKIIKINHYHRTERVTVCPYEMFFKNLS